jgi:hypothetical protein
MSSMIAIGQILPIEFNPSLLRNFKTTEQNSYIIEYQQPPFSPLHHAASGRNPIWRPQRCDYNFNESGDYYFEKFEYDKEGIMLKITQETYSGDFLAIGTMNQTFRKKGWDFLDTATYYLKENGDFVPYGRRLFNYHYYDRLQIDSFFYEEYSQYWDMQKQEWVYQAKYREDYIDTVLFQTRRMSWYMFQNGEWITAPYYGYIFQYDSSGVIVSEQFVMNGDTARKEDYIFHEDGSVVGSLIYSRQGDGTWKPVMKTTDYVWKEWYKNGCHNALLQVGMDFEYVSIADKRCKLESRNVWILNDENEWQQTGFNRKQWDINGTKSNIDSSFNINENVPYLASVGGHIYNERDDYTQYFSYFYSVPDEQGKQQLLDGQDKYYLSLYHETYQEIEEKYAWSWNYNFEYQRWDSLYRYHEMYSDWIDVSNTVISENPSRNSVVSVIPNPSTDNVYITAEEMIYSIELYDVTGRHILSQTGKDKTSELHLADLPKGLYIVKITLQNGSVNTKKLIRQ